MLKEDGKHYFRMTDGSEICLNDLLVPITTERADLEENKTQITDEYISRANKIVELMFETEDDETMESFGKALGRIGKQRRRSLKPRGRLWAVAEPIIVSTKFNRISSEIGIWKPNTITAIAGGLSEWGGEFEAWIIRDRFMRERSFDPEQRHYLLNSVANLGGINAARVLEVALKQASEGKYRYDTEIIALIDDLITGGASEVTEAVDRVEGRKLLAAHRKNDAVLKVEEALKNLDGRMRTHASWTLELFK